MTVTEFKHKIAAINDSDNMELDEMCITRLLYVSKEYGANGEDCAYLLKFIAKKLDIEL